MLNNLYEVKIDKLSSTTVYSMKGLLKRVYLATMFFSFLQSINAVAAPSIDFQGFKLDPGGSVSLNLSQYMVLNQRDQGTCYANALAAMIDSILNADAIKQGSSNRWVSSPLAISSQYASQKGFDYMRDVQYNVDQMFGRKRSYCESSADNVNGGQVCDAFDTLKNKYSFTLYKRENIEGVIEKNFGATVFKNVGYYLLPKLFRACRDDISKLPNIGNGVNPPAALVGNCIALTQRLEATKLQWWNAYSGINKKDFLNVSGCFDYHLGSNCNTSQFQQFLVIMKSYKPDGFGLFIDNFGYSFNASSILNPYTCSSITIPNRGGPSYMRSEILKSLKNGIPVGYDFHTSRFSASGQAVAGHSLHSVIIYKVERYIKGTTEDWVYYIRNSWGLKEPMNDGGCKPEWSSKILLGVTGGATGVSCDKDNTGDAVVGESTLYNASVGLNIIKI